MARKWILHDRRDGTKMKSLLSEVVSRSGCRARPFSTLQVMYYGRISPLRLNIDISLMRNWNQSVLYVESAAKYR